MNFETKVKASILSSIVGDALGVPVESTSREELTLRTVKSMFGYGRYNLPAGTWSDDSSMSLCTIETLCDEYSVEKLGSSFCRWLFNGHWTPFGYAFDAGLTTYMALDAIREGASARISGRTTEDDNGNGSLMRILPAAIWYRQDETEAYMARIHELSSITHAHPRALVGCGIYALLVRELLLTDDKFAAYYAAVDQAIAFYNHYEGFKKELSHFSRVLSKQLPQLKESEINSSGYIVDTLEAGIWCLLQFADTRSIIVSAVNLGIDTDTTGSIAGGLGGLVYGLSEIPEDWLNALSRKNDIDAILNTFIAHLMGTFRASRD